MRRTTNERWLRSGGRSRPGKWIRWAGLVIGGIIATHGSRGVATGQGVDCDPAKVVTAEACAKCHANEVRVWQATPHAQTFETLSRRPEAREICKKLGLRSVKRSDVCIQCHFTRQQVSADRVRPVSGISCESCHGAAADWLNLHNDYGGPNATKDSETDSHRQQRWAQSLAAGMRNTRNLYRIASACYRCHTIPNERLVNVGGHHATSDDFELVRWSQGTVRHNFLRTQGTSNAAVDIERLRVMYVVGLIADLEYSTRATALATEKSTYGLQVARRAANVAVRLFQLQQEVHDPDIQRALEAFAEADLKINHREPLLAIADRIRQAGIAFATRADGSTLAAVDAHLPDPASYR